MRCGRIIYFIVPGLIIFLASCSSSGPVRQVDPELYRTAKSARTAFNRGEYEQAARLYLRSLNRARAMDNGAEIGNNSYNLAACFMELREFDRARALLDESRDAFSRAGRVPEGLRILEIKNALARGSLEEAEALLAPAGKGRARSVAPEILIQDKLLRADLALKRDDPATAREELKGIRDELRDAENDSLRAEFDRMEGELLLREGKFKAAGAAFDHRADLLRKGGHYRGMAVVLGRAGDAYWDGRAYREALYRFFRSSRSLLAQEDPAAALLMIKSALDVAVECPRDPILRQVRGLFNEIKVALEATSSERSE